MRVHKTTTTRTIQHMGKIRQLRQLVVFLFLHCLLFPTCSVPTFFMKWNNDGPCIGVDERLIGHGSPTLSALRPKQLTRCCTEVYLRRLRRLRIYRFLGGWRLHVQIRMKYSAIAIPSECEEFTHHPSPIAVIGSMNVVSPTILTLCCG